MYGRRFIRTGLALLAGLAACDDAPTGPARGWERYDERAGWERKAVNTARSYVRVTARFAHVETGEELVADVVAACGGRAAQWDSDEPTAGFRIYPEADFTPLPGGGVLMMAVTALCGQYIFDARKNDTIRRRGPDTLLPVMVWFPDEDDLAAGWMYVTEKAYDSPISPVRWLGTEYRPASAEEWRDWRERQVAEWEPYGAVPSPWGWGYYRQTDDVRERFWAANQGRGLPYAGCEGYARVRAPAELIERVFALHAPEAEGRYLGMKHLPGYRGLGHHLDPYENETEAVHGEVTALFRSEEAWRFPPGNAASGAITYSGSGYIDAESNGDPPYVMPDYFPYLHAGLVRSRLPHSIGAFNDGTLIADEAYDGFAACIGLNSTEQEAIKPHGDEGFHVGDVPVRAIWVKGEMVEGIGQVDQPYYVFDRVENYVYTLERR